MPNTWDPTAPSPSEALERLLSGNRRFREGRGRVLASGWSPEPRPSPQRPFAIVLGCSDSRTPVEILFDQGFGDLFVVRIAGNIVAPSVVGSIEFAASQFGTRLVVVMGHSHCGAVTATINALATGLGPDSKNIRSITDRIAPHIAPAAQRALLPNKPNEPNEPNAGTRCDTVLREAIRANVLASTDHLRHGSRILEDLVLGGRLVVVGAEYVLETGAVHVFDGPSELLSEPF